MNGRGARTTVQGWLESHVPWLLGVIVSVLSLAYMAVNVVEPFAALTQMLDAAITFGSIIVGFVGALLAILVTVWDSDAIRTLFETWIRERLRSFFRGTIVGGFLLVTLSGILHLGSTINTVTWDGIGGLAPFELLLGAWLGLSVYVLLSAYRIMSIMMHIIFNARQNENEELPGITMDPKRKEEFRERIARRDGETS